MEKKNPSDLLKEVSALLMSNGYSLTQLEFIEGNPTVTHSFEAGKYVRTQNLVQSPLSAIVARDAA